MARNRARLIVGILLVMGVVVLPGTASAATVTPTRIMPLGNSITAGTNDPGSYRIALEDMLVSGGYAFDFVGSQSNGPDSLTDKDHEGHPGFTIAEIATGVSSWLTVSQPDVVLLLIGTNDILQDLDLSHAPERLASLLGIMAATAPGTTVLVSTIPPLVGASRDAAVQTFNAAIPGVVDQQKAAGHKVMLVDGHAALTLADLDPDGIHPNAAGYDKLAAAWYPVLAPLVAQGTAEPPPPPPPSTSCAAGEWTAEYFSNVSLSGTPALVRCESVIDHGWGLGAPASGLPADNFSVRWSSTQSMVAGSVTLTATADDGVRVSLDGTRVIDGWRDQSATTYTATRTVTAGDHALVVEYYERGWDAVARFAISGVAEPPPPPPPPPSTSCAAGEWTAEYFSNVSLSGTPALVRCESVIDHGWGLGAPASGLPADNFSVRWSSTQSMVAGSVTLTATADDGVRVSLDGTRVIDGWRDQSATTYTATRTVTAGDHALVVEYYERGWDAVARFAISGVAEPPPPPPPPPSTSCAAGEWTAEYFSNVSLSGTPALVRCESVIDHGWGLGAPASGLPADNFSVRWSSTQSMVAGSVTLTATADDGVRVSLDGTRVIDGWRDQSATTYTATRTVTAGDHALVVEYYERGWDAVARFGFLQP